MTISTTTSRVDALGNGVATVFSFSPVVIFASSDLVVTKVSATGAETVLAEGAGSTNYSVAVAAYPDTGSITYPASGGTPLALGETLVMKRVLAILQTTHLENQGGYFPEVQETVFDRETCIAQQQQEQIDRSLKVAIDDVTIGAIPNAATRALKPLGFDVNGDPIAMDGLAGSVVSTAMAPVVASATTDAALGLLGAGTTGLALLKTTTAVAAQTLLASGITAKSAGYTIVAGDRGTLFKVTNTAVLTLPANATAGAGWTCRVANFSTIASPKSVTVIRAGSDVVDVGSDATVYVLPGETVEFMADGAGLWITRGRTIKGRVINEKTYTNAGSSSASTSIVAVQTAVFSYQPVCSASLLDISYFFCGGNLSEQATAVSTAFQIYETTSGNVALSGQIVQTSTNSSGSPQVQSGIPVAVSTSNAALTARTFQLFALTTNAASSVFVNNITAIIREAMNA